MPFDVLRLTSGTLIVHPRPNGPLPFPVLYARESCGWKPLRPAGSSIGTVKLPVPVKRSGENVSPMPFTAPPPVGRVMAWDVTPDLSLIVRVPSWTHLRAG